MVRGDIHTLTLPRRRGHAQHGRRYAVIVRADALLTLSSVVICPTSQSTPPASFHPEVEIEGVTTSVMCELVGVAVARALGDNVGHLSHTEMGAVDDALALVLDLR